MLLFAIKNRCGRRYGGLCVCISRVELEFSIPLPEQSRGYGRICVLVEWNIEHKINRECGRGPGSGECQEMRAGDDTIELNDRFLRRACFCRKIFPIARVMDYDDGPCPMPRQYVRLQ